MENKGGDSDSDTVYDSVTTASPYPPPRPPTFPGARRGGEGSDGVIVVKGEEAAPIHGDPNVWEYTNTLDDVKGTMRSQQEGGPVQDPVVREILPPLPLPPPSPLERNMRTATIRRQPPQPQHASPLPSRPPQQQQPPPLTANAMGIGGSPQLGRG